MAYETYTTEALVCGSTPRSEHDVTLRLYTRDAGMIYARAPGARALASKLRYGLQDFSHVRVSLVRGRGDWRVIGAVMIENFYYTAPTRKERIPLLSSMRFIRRLIHGDGATGDVFDVILDGMRTLAEGTHSTRGEKLFMLRVLHHLGYIAPRAPYAPLVHALSLTHACELCGEEGELEEEIHEAVENALAVSHL